MRLREYGSFIESLRRDEFIAIDDVREDPRTSTASAALEQRSARSFVNVPVLEQDRLVAVLFVNNAKPRKWKAEDLALIRDVGERTRTAVQRYRNAKALKESEARYRTLFEAIDVGFCIIEMKFDAADVPIDFRLWEINPAFEKQTGLVGAGGKWISEVAPGLERHWFEAYGRVVRTGKPARFENFAQPFGRWYDVHAFRIAADSHRIAILFNDITDRKNAEAQLRDLNETLEQRVAERTQERDRLWTLSEDMLARADYAGNLSAVNPAWTKVLGWSEKKLLADPYVDIIHPDNVGAVVEALREMGRTGQPTRFENRILTASGAWKPIGWTVSPEPDGTNFIAVGRDLSQEKARQRDLIQAQEALRQSQKMEAMGQLTGGVAHDFNNLLTPIVGSLDMLQRKGLGTERERMLIAGAVQSAERAKILVQRLLAFARRQPLQPSAVDIKALVTGMAELIASTTGPQIKIVVDTPDNLPAARADPNQLEMALLNLAVNARDAMPEGGTLRISLAERTANPGDRAPLDPGHYVCLSVADTGAGMDEATMARAVEPFFSTKGIGKGTGLGLSMVHGLALQLGGALTIQSRKGLGTNMELWLPLSHSMPENQKTAHELPVKTMARGTALLVDDEELVRQSTFDMLTDLGFQVVDVSSAEQALERIHAGLRPELLVTDHLMTGMNGTDLARAVLSKFPDMKVLIISGYADVEGIAPDLPRLTKPFRQADLAAIVAVRMGGTASP